MNDTGCRVHDVLAAALTGISTTSLTDDALLVDAGVDSLRLLDILVRLEPEFGLTIRDHAVFSARLRTVGDLVNFVEEQRALPDNAPTGES